MLIHIDYLTIESNIGVNILIVTDHCSSQTAKATAKTLWERFCVLCFSRNHHFLLGMKFQK